MGGSKWLRRRFAAQDRALLLDRVAIETAKPAPVIGQRGGRHIGLTAPWNPVRVILGVHCVCSVKSVLTLYIVRR